MEIQPAIKAEKVSKVFRLPHEKQSSVKSLFVNVFRSNKGYELQKALKDVTFEIRQGDFFGIVGRNGSGKSTLLKLLAGIYNPSSGSIHVNGSLTPFIELGVGFNPELTGRENVYLNGALLGFNRKEMHMMYKDIVEFAELERFMDQKLKNYSSGMQVRLAFSIAIRAKSDILLIDEVLAVGDANFQKKCFDYFRQLKADRKTVILVSHDMESVRKFCDRAMLIQDGEVVLIGTADDVSDEYTRRNMETETKRAGATTDKSDNDKPVQIVSAQLTDENGKEIHSLLGGRPAKLEVIYKLRQKDIDELNIGVGMHADPNGYVLSYNTQMDGFKLESGKNSITLRIDKLPLLNGTYYINIVCFGKDEFIPYDFASRVLDFQVHNTGAAANYRGIVNLKHGWEQ
jgi:ABC-2 type transport system ATP-binding protein